MEEIVARVPGNWTMTPQAKGAGIKFIDDMGYERIRMHGPSKVAPSGSNSASRWTLRVMDQSGNYFDNASNIVHFKANEGHIPVMGNPVLKRP